MKRGSAPGGSDGSGQSTGRRAAKVEERNMRKNFAMLAPRGGPAVDDAAFAGDVRIMWYSDGVEGEVMQDLLDRFMKDNPDINVTLDNVSYKVVQEQLPVQLEAGRGPDIARVTNLKDTGRALARPDALHHRPEILAGQFRRPGRLDAARRLQGDHRLHDADHADRRLRQQDAVRPGRRGAARRQGDLGRMGRGGRKVRTASSSTRVGARPLRPPHLGAEHLLWRQLHRRRRHAGAGRRGRQGLRRKVRRLDRRRAA